VTADLPASALIDPQAEFFSCLRLACKNLWLLFGLDEKQWKRTFSAKKISILRNLWLNIWQKALVISWWKKNEKMQFTTTVN